MRITAVLTLGAQRLAYRWYSTAIVTFTFVCVVGGLGFEPRVFTLSCNPFF